MSTMKKMTSNEKMMKYPVVEKTHAAINSKLFSKLNHLNIALYEVELAKTEIENKEPITLHLFILQYTELSMLGLFYNFSTKFLDLNEFKDFQMDTDSLYLALAEKQVADCIRPEMKAEFEHLRTKDCTDSFTADPVAIFLQRRCCDKQKKHDKREPGLFKELFRCTETQRCVVFVAKLTAASRLRQTYS